MKSAEEWRREYKHMLPNNYGITKELIEEIQLDSWKQGMTDAANLTDSISDMAFVFVPNILHARDSKTNP